jgi:hypothetical protein
MDILKIIWIFTREYTYVYRCPLGKHFALLLLVVVLVVLGWRPFIKLQKLDQT